MGDLTHADLIAMGDSITERVNERVVREVTLTRNELGQRMDDLAHRQKELATYQRAQNGRVGDLESAVAALRTQERSSDGLTRKQKTALFGIATAAGAGAIERVLHLLGLMK